jgi:hypothetical protein
MREPEPIAEYLDAVSRAIAFDIALSRRVRKEVEDHLWESVSHASCADPIEAQRQAIANFGDAREIACQYAASSLLAQTRRVGIWAFIALVGIYAAMKGRGAWYGLMQWELTHHLKDVIATWHAIDLNAFRIALAIGIFALGYVASLRAPAGFHKTYRTQVKRCIVLCTAAAVALVISVLIDTVITGLRLFETRVSALSLIAASSVVAEMALITLLALNIRTTIRRIALASALTDS